MKIINEGTEFVAQRALEKHIFQPSKLIRKNVKQIFAVCSTSDIFPSHCIDDDCLFCLCQHILLESHEFIDAEIE